MRSERAPWGNFPLAITNGALGDISKDPDYLVAKTGDEDAAWRLVSRLLKEETVAAMIDTFRPTQSTTLLLPVLAQESVGKNKIPLAMAAVIAEQTGLSYTESIFQINHVGRTNKDGDSRLLSQPIFSGTVEKRDYILLDDTLTMGGTIAALRGHILRHGGNVIGAMVMSAQQRSLQLAPTAKILDNIRQKHGAEIEHFFKQELGYGLERLTNSEAAHVYAYPDADTLRTRIAQARYVASFGTAENNEVAGEPQEVQFARLTWQLRENHHPKAILKTEKPTAPCRGCVVLATENFIIQQVADGSRYFQIHRKDALSRIPDVGERVNISYSSKESLARVREFTQGQKCRR